VRVAIVIERFERGAGGAESAAWHLVRELAGRGLELAVVCRAAAEPPPPGVELVRLGVSDLWQPWRLVRFSQLAARTVRRGFDVVHAFSRTRHQDVYRAGGGSHADYLEHVHRWPAARRWLSPRHRTILLLERAVFADPTQLVECNAHGVAAELARRHGVPAERLAVVYNGVDTRRFHPERREAERARMRAALGLRGPGALFVGSGWRRKGLDLAIAGLAAAPRDAELVVAGRGDPRPWRELARRHGVAGRVQFLGARADVELLHAAADLLVLPTRYDPFANACLEAMASGLPVATTPHNGVAELIRDGENGLLAEDDFGKVFERLADPPALARLGAAARRTALALDWSRHAEATLALYARVPRRR
jgi:UDP-glucose:(heptosyl)LPS alpha-1,3-glucosyltransferase